MPEHSAVSGAGLCTLPSCGPSTAIMRARTAAGYIRYPGRTSTVPRWQSRPTCRNRNLTTPHSVIRYEEAFRQSVSLKEAFACYEPPLVPPAYGLDGLY